jgi:hypothetical protein
MNRTLAVAALTLLTGCIVAPPEESVGAASAAITAPNYEREVYSPRLRACMPALAGPLTAFCVVAWGGVESGEPTPNAYRCDTGATAGPGCREGMWESEPVWCCP